MLYDADLPWSSAVRMPSDRRRTSPRLVGGGLFPALVFSAVALLLLLPGTLGSSVGDDGVGSTTGTIIPANVTLGSSVGHHARSPFYALVLDPTGLGPVSATDLGLYLNSTPFTWFRLSEVSAGYDPTTLTNWVPPSSGSGAYVPQYGAAINLTWFQSWCYSRTPHCSWIWDLPAEENNTTAAVHVATYLHNVLKFAPTAWELGNEPNAWTHYGINASRWTTSDSSTPTGIAYATMVHNYITAVSALFPKDRFIGIESNCACGVDLVSTTAAVDGSLVWAMAYHSYPWTNDSSAKVSQFLGALESPTRNLSYTASHMRQLMTTSCPNCSNIPIQVGEYNAGPVPVHSPISWNYSGAPFMAASIIQALQANVSMLTTYSLGFLYNTSTGAVYPEGVLFQEIIKNLTMGTDYLVNVSAPGVGGVYGMLIVRGAHQSLLIVNTNVTKAITFSLGSPVFPVGGTGSMWSWDPRTPLPTVQTGVTVPSSFTVWSQGILLVNNY